MPNVWNRTLCKSYMAVINSKLILVATDGLDDRCAWPKALSQSVIYVSESGLGVKSVSKTLVNGSYWNVSAV